jgi:DUF1680 family protein
LYVNQYLESEYQGKDILFKIETQYPETENINIRIQSTGSIKKTLQLRIPAWCSTPVVKLNGKNVSNVHSGAYLSLSKKWTKGDVIELNFPMELKWIKREHHSDYTFEQLPIGGERMYTASPTDRIPFALTRGPVIYAFDMVWNDEVDPTLKLDSDLIVDTHLTPTLTGKPNEKILGPVYKTHAHYNNKESEIILTPFTNIGYWYRNEDNKPDKNEKTYSYAIWLYDHK